MDEELEQVGKNENVETTATTNEDQPKYSKADVQALMKRRVERSHNAFFKRYGVNDLNGLDDLVNKSKQLSDVYVKNSELLRENAFLRNNIAPERYDDIVNYFKGANIDFSEEELLKALINHPEWLKQQTTITKMGSEAHNETRPSDRERASKLLGVKL